MTVTYLREAPPASEQDIQRLEQSLGRPLPDAYRSYLLGRNGGRLAPNTDAVKLVFGVGADAPDWANLWKKLTVFAGRVPAWLLPVAQDEYGNLYAISLRVQDRGSVWFWDHEEEASEDEPPAEDNITLTAPDWNTFLENLRPA